MVRRQDRRAEPAVPRDSQTPLAQSAGDAVVAAATASGWETTRHKLARLLGHGDPAKTNLMEQRLTETREQLLGAPGASLESARATLAAQWASWLTDLLTKDPVIRPGLLALVQQIHMALGAVSPAAIPRDAMPVGPISPGLATS